MTLDLFIREAVLDGGGGDGGAPAAAPPAAEPAAPPAVEPQSEGEPAPPVEERSYSQAEHDAAVRQAAFEAAEEAYALAQGRQFDPPIAGATPGPMSGQQPAYGEQPGQFALVPVPELDPFDPESIAAYNDARETNQLIRMSMLMNQQIGPVTQTFEQQREQEQYEHNNQIAEDMKAAAIAAGPDVTEKGQAFIRPLADAIFPHFAERYGNGMRAAEAAIYAATDEIRAWEAEVADRARTTQANELATLGGAPVEPGVAGAASPLPGTPMRYESPRSVAADLLAKYGTS